MFPGHRGASESGEISDFRQANLPGVNDPFTDGAPAFMDRYSAFA